MIWQQQGMTLIEILIVLVIIALLAFLSGSFSGAWMHSNRLIEGENLLRQAFDLNRAMSYRNSTGAVAEEPASVLCFDQNELSVHGANASTGAVSCASTPTLWRADIAHSVTITNQGQPFLCACFNNHAQLTTQSCNQCSTDLDFALQSGGENIEFTLNSLR